MTRRTRSSQADQPAGEAPFNQALAALRDRLPTGWTPPAEPPAAATPPARDPAPPARAVVRLERKGRGGKEATVVEKLGLDAAALARWAEALKRGLGCGGGVEGEAIALQGDQRDRVVKWLEGRKVKKIVRG